MLVDMAPFDPSEDNGQRLDWHVLRDGGITLYKSKSYLAGDMEWLRSEGYRIVSFDCREWTSSEQMHQRLSEELSFPGYYGRNLDALNDCMLGDLNVPDAGGLALLLRRFDAYSNGPGAKPYPSGRNEAEIILDILASASRYYLLTGGRLITLIQSDDPHIHFEDLGGVSAHWNRRERLNKNRELPIH